MPAYIVSNTFFSVLTMCDEALQNYTNTFILINIFPFQMFHNISYLQKFPGFDIIIEVILSKRELWEEYFQVSSTLIWLYDISL